MENVILRNELLRWSGCCPRARETTLAIIITKIDIGIVIYYYKYITMRRRFFMGIVKQKNPKTGVVYV